MTLTYVVSGFAVGVLVGDDVGVLVDTNAECAVCTQKAAARTLNSKFQCRGRAI